MYMSFQFSVVCGGSWVMLQLGLKVSTRCTGSEENIEIRDLLSHRKIVFSKDCNFTP